jgi:hypothetical protein
LCPTCSRQADQAQVQVGHGAVVTDGIAAMCRGVVPEHDERRDVVRAEPLSKGDRGGVRAIAVLLPASGRASTSPVSTQTAAKELVFSPSRGLVTSTSAGVPLSTPCPRSSTSA